MKIMVAYDGTLQAKEALVYGMQKAREKGGEVIALQVFNSPLFMDYDGALSTRDAAKAEAGRFLAEAKTIIREKGAGVKASVFSGEGDPEEMVIGFAKSEKVDVLLCPPRYKNIIASYRKALAKTGATLADAEFAGEAEKRNLTACAVASRSN